MNQRNTINQNSSVYWQFFFLIIGPNSSQLFAAVVVFLIQHSVHSLAQTCLLLFIHFIDYLLLSYCTYN